MGPGMVSKDIDLTLLKVILFDFSYLAKIQKNIKIIQEQSDSKRKTNFK